MTTHTSLPAPTPQQLRSALAYEKQHRNVLQRQLHRRLPRIWPANMLDEIDFYGRLIETLELPDAQEAHEAALCDLLERHPKWLKQAYLPFSRRTVRMAFNALRGTDDEQAPECVRELAEEDTSDPEKAEQVLSCLVEVGRPEFQIAYSWLTKGEDKARADHELPSRGNENAQAPTIDWSPLCEQIAKEAIAASQVEPSRGIVDQLSSYIERLSAIESAHRAWLAEWTKLEDALSIISDVASTLRSKGEDVLANRFDALTSTKNRWPASADVSPTEWKEAVRVHCSELAEALSDLDANRAEISKANRQQDFAAVGELAVMAREQQNRCDRHRSALDELIEVLQHDKAQGKTPSSPTADPTSQPEIASPEADVESYVELASVHEAKATQATVKRGSESSGTDLELGSSTASIESTAVPDSVNSDQARPLAEPPPPAVPTESPQLTSQQERDAASTQPIEEHPSDAKGPEAHESEHTFPDFSVQITVAELVDEIRRQSGKERAHRANGLVYRLVCDGRPGLAAHLAQAIRAEHGEAYCAVAPELLRATVLAAAVRSPFGEAAERLRDLITDLLSFDFGQRTMRRQPHLALYAVAAALRPSLVAPDTTNAHELLRRIPRNEDFQALHQLRETILEYHRYGFAQNPAFLRAAHEINSWQELLHAVQDEARIWWVANRQKVIKYRRATHIWQHWLDPQERLGVLLERLSNEGPESKAHVVETVTMWGQRPFVERAIIEADKDIHGQTARLRPIEGNARQVLLRNVEDLMALADRWLEVVKAHPEDMPAHLGQRAEQWRKKVSEFAPKCLQMLDDFAQQIPDSLQIQAAVTSAKGAVEGFISVLRDGLSDTSPPWYQSLNGELLHLDNPPRQASWGPTGILSLDNLLIVVQKRDGDWPATFERHIANCDLLAAGRIVELLESSRPPTVEVEQLAQRQSEAEEHCRDLLVQRVAEIRNAIELAVIEGHLPESDRSRFIERLEASDQAGIQDLRKEFDELDAIQRRLKEGREAQVKEVRERLHAGDIKRIDPALFERIESLLNEGDTLTANEYIALAESGQEIPDSTLIGDAFGSYFPDKVVQLNSFLGEQRRPRELVSQIESGQSIGPVDMRVVPGTQAQSAAKMLRAWQLAKDRRDPLQDHVYNFLEQVGFQVQDLAVDATNRGPREMWLDLRARPLADRDACVIPRYGSLAQGHYQVLCVWNAPSEGEVITLTAPRRRELPVIVLYLSRMTEQRRRDLAYQCRERRQTLLVVDETLVYFLCGARGPRLPELFRCAFPFTVENPYTIASSSVPVEMFFGRRQERQSLFDPYGSNLLYGGRQLGKTALLREVQRRNHDPDRGIVVHWIDLKAEGIGLNRPADEVWDVIGTALRQDGIVKGQVTRQEKTSEQVIGWLQKEPRRRILLLLDEADAFLFQDSRERQYATLAKLKDLMDRTDRRFKVVLAGLHNVQRGARDVNTPIAHMGQPICVGPLLAGGEVREAMLLVSMPFTTLGYRFDRDVESRILSHTNYYPSLIQIFCWHLLEHLNDNGRTHFDRRTSPPYRITVHHVEEAFRQKELRSAIAERFRFTLELDGRYRLIALRIALETLERRRGGLDTSDGLDVDWIRSEALALWERGFEERSYEAFRNLLDEMIGLGILRRAGNGNRYALRSPNVINLLGTAEEIEEALLDAADKEPPMVYESATYRRYLPDDHWIRSPLTGQQESEILEPAHGVCVLFGLHLAGLRRVTEFLEPADRSLPGIRVTKLHPVADRNGFEAALGEAIERPDKGWEGVHLIVVDHEQPWSDAWVTSALQVTKKRRAKRLYHRVLFIGDADAAWRWVVLEPGIRDRLEGAGTNVLGLKPWKDDALRRWMADAGFGPVHDRDQRELFTAATGNWGELLHELGARIHENTARWKEIVEQYGAESGIPWLERENLMAAALPVLEAMRDDEYDFSTEDLHVLLEDRMDKAEILRILRWADLLHLVHVAGRGLWRLDPLVSRLLAQWEGR
jgi:hypothetical protein